MRDPDQRRDDEARPEDDSPADSDAYPGHEEPDPAEVVGDDDNPIDLSSPRIQDPYHRDSLEERLAEERPERPRRRDLPDDDVTRPILSQDEGEVGYGSQEEVDDDEEDEDRSAEEQAIHPESGS